MRRWVYAIPAKPTGYLLKCLLMALVIWNISSLAFPKTGFSFSSATISRRFFGSCSLCFLMYAHTFFATCGRDMGADDPSTSASCAEGFKGAWAIFKKAVFVFFLGITCSSICLHNSMDRRPVEPKLILRLPEPVWSGQRASDSRDTHFRSR